ncbi:MAG: hypothetical protein RI885_1885 [Actinomycetota bacterium]|jgi:cellobiose transport system substrate-binding protein
MIRKTKLTAALAATAALTLLAGCSSGGGDDTADTVTLDVWLFGGMGLDEVVAQYEEDNPGIDINVKGANSDEQAQALTTALAGGSVPDVAAIEGSYLAKFKAQPQNFVDMRTLGADEIADTYLDWRWDQGVAADGEVIGIPTDVGGLAMAYRTDLFAAAGLPTNRDEVGALWSTWDDFMAVGEQYKAATGKGMIDTVVAAVYNASVRQGSEQYYGDDDELIYETNDQVRTSFDRAIEAIPFSSQIKPFSEEWNAGMNNGDFAVLSAPSYMMTYIKQQAPDTAGKWDIATVPGNSGSAGGSQLTIPAKSDNPEEAYDFITWLLAPEQQLTVFQTNGNFPTTPELYDTPDIQDFTNDFFGGAPVGQIYSASVQSVEPIYEGPEHRVIETALVNVMDEVEAGQVDKADAWDTALTTVETALKG